MKYALMIPAILLAGCAPVATGERIAPASSVPTVTRIVPERMASLDPADSILFWSDERRSAAFRNMEDQFAGQMVASAATPRALPRGPALSDRTADLARAYMADTRAAGLMVLRDGRIAFEEYGLGLSPEQRWTSFSVAKSFTSTLLGMAIAQGAIASIEAPVTDILPELAGTAYEGVTIEQIATMTSGVRWNENYGDPASDVARMLAVEPVPGESQAVTYARTLTRDAPAGEKFTYKTLETNLLGLIVERAVGMSLAEYAAQTLVPAAGFEGELFWMQDLTGGSIGGCCLSLTLADYARFGQFVLDGGDDLVPPGWFERAGSSLVSLGEGFGYGYQWWTYPGEAFGAQGIFGQAVTIVPDQNLVVAVVGNWPEPTSSANRLAFQRLVNTIWADRR